MSYKNDSSDEGFKAFMFLMLAAAVLLISLAVSNENQREKCKSLSKQGVKVYLSEGLVAVECNIVGRELMP